MSAGDWVVITAALARADQACPYHGTDFAKLGTESFGVPRCDSCKQPWRVREALAALERLLDARTAQPKLSPEYGWAPDGDASDVRWSLNPDPTAALRWVHQCIELSGGSVFVREVTEWRQEP